MSETGQAIDRYASVMAEAKRVAVMRGTTRTTAKRVDILRRDYGEGMDDLRRLAGSIKQHTLENLGTYLEQAEAAMAGNGVKVHWAADAASAREQVLGIMREKGVKRLVKSKSMATEEIELNPYLEENGVEVVETDLGEYIVQIDGDHPSHIVAPIVHKNRDEIARSFEREGLGAYDDEPEVITRRARAHLRQKYLQSDVGMTGGNFISAESGRLVLVTNEGNARFSMAANGLHIALVGIEKVVPRDRDLAVFLNLLGRSATGQQLTVYTQFINGPRSAGQPSGPEEMHVVLLDNGRSDILKGDCKEILRCIRCGACQNVCPVYRQASGHAYRSVYGGPVGAVLSPLLAASEGRFRELGDLPKASSLCGACREVCPVDIPIPDMLLKLREKGKLEGVASPGSPGMGGFGMLATAPVLWRGAMGASKLMNQVPAEMLPVKPLQAWLKLRTLPEWRGGEFRKWVRGRRGKSGKDEREGEGEGGNC